MRAESCPDEPGGAPSRVVLGRSHDARVSRVRHQYAVILGLILATLAFGLAAADTNAARLVNVILQAATLVAAVVVSRAPSWMVRLAIGVSLLLVAGSFLSLLGTDEFGADSVRLISMLLVALAAPAIIFSLIRNVREEQGITIHTMFGVLCLYLLIGILFASILSTFQEVFNSHVVEEAVAYPDDYLYFSFATLTTVGYGDIIAGNDIGRSLAITEALIGQIYLVTVVALIVSNLGPSRRSRPRS
jgi:voltage-gated potassium channel